MYFREAMGGSFEAVLRHHEERTDSWHPAVGGKALLSVHPWSSKARSQLVQVSSDTARGRRARIQRAFLPQRPLDQGGHGGAHYGYEKLTQTLPWSSRMLASTSVSDRAWRGDAHQRSE